MAAVALAEAVMTMASQPTQHVFSLPKGRRIKPFSPQDVPHELRTFQYGSVACAQARTPERRQGGHIIRDTALVGQQRPRAAPLAVRELRNKGESREPPLGSAPGVLARASTRTARAKGVRAKDALAKGARAKSMCAAVPCLGPAKVATDRFVVADELDTVVDEGGFRLARSLEHPALVPFVRTRVGGGVVIYAGQTDR